MPTPKMPGRIKKKMGERPQNKQWHFGKKQVLGESKTANYPSKEQRIRDYRAGKARMKPAKSSGLVKAPGRSLIPMSQARGGTSGNLNFKAMPRPETRALVPMGKSSGEMSGSMAGKYTGGNWGRFKRAAAGYGRQAMSAYAKAPKWAKRGGAVGLGLGAGYLGYKALTGGGGQSDAMPSMPKQTPSFPGVGGTPMGPLRRFEAGRGTPAGVTKKPPMPMPMPKQPITPKAPKAPMKSGGGMRGGGMRGGSSSGMNLGANWQTAGVLAGAGLIGYLAGRRRKPKTTVNQFKYTYY